jgi:hypothetical protein
VSNRQTSWTRRTFVRELLGPRATLELPPRAPDRVLVPVVYLLRGGSAASDGDGIRSHPPRGIAVQLRRPPGDPGGDRTERETRSRGPMRISWRRP